MTGYSTGGQNISGQFGMPLYGISGLLPFTGNYYWVDGTNGSDGNTGGPTDPFKTLSQAQNSALAGNNDVIFFTGTYSPTATFTWSKNNTHLIGLSPSPYATPKISVASTTATSGAFSPLVNVTATGCIFKNFSVVSGINQAATQVCWAEAGGHNTYINVNLNQVGNATAGAQAGNRALTMASVNNFFLECVIGSDALVRATNGNASLTFLATSGASKFVNCLFPMWSSAAGNTFATAAATTMTGTTVFNGCQFTNNIQGAGYTANTAGFSISTTAGGIVLLDANSVMVGATAIATSGPVYISGAVPTATTSNIAVAAT